MAFQAGKSGNPAGRKPGSVNKATAAAKERIEQVLGELDVSLLTDLEALKPEQRVELWVKLQEFIRPKLSRTALTSASGEGAPGIVTVRIAHGYLDTNGQYVEAPPLRNREQDVLD